MNSVPDCSDLQATLQSESLLYVHQRREAAMQGAELRKPLDTQSSVGWATAGD